MNKLLSHLLNFISHYTQYSIIQIKFIKGENSAILIFVVASLKWKHRTKQDSNNIKYLHVYFVLGNFHRLCYYVSQAFDWPLITIEIIIIIILVE